MNPSKSAQDVLRCHLCETPVPPFCCEVCHIYLCKVCASEHMLDDSTEHKVVPIKQHLSALLYPKCIKHSSKICELYCKKCTSPICALCVSSNEHRGHGFSYLLECVESKKASSKRDLQELESSIIIKHREFASHICNQKANLDKNLEEVNRAIDEHGEKLHKQVSDVVEKLKSDIVKKHENKFDALNKAAEKNALTISDIEKCIDKAKELQASNDLALAFEYRCRNDEFRNTPIKHNAALPKFVAKEIKTDKLSEQFGSLSMTSDIECDVTTASVNDLSSEVQIAFGRANVMLYDDAAEKWVASGTSQGLSQVRIYRHITNNTLRVVGRMNQKVTIDCVISRGTTYKYEKTTPTFLCLRDNQLKEVYGLNFSDERDAKAFALAIATVLDK